MDVIQPESSALYLSYWGKTDREKPVPGPDDYHLAVYHFLDVAAVAFELLSQERQWLKQFSAQLRMSETDAKQLMVFWIAIHDLGKLNRSFQSKCLPLYTQLFPGDPAYTESVTHGTTGWHAWKHFGERVFVDFLGERLEDDDDFGEGWSAVFQIWSAAVTGHHGMPPDSGVGSQALQQFSDRDKAAVESAIIALWNLICGDMQLGWHEDLEEFAAKSSWLLAGLAILSDWLGSDREFFEFRSQPMSLDAYWKNDALPAAKKAVRDKRIVIPDAMPAGDMREMFPDIKIPTPLQEWAQNVALDDGPQLFILEDTTGSGKTEAALTLAHRLISNGNARGLFMGLPTMATANAMFERVVSMHERLFEDRAAATLVLSHGARHLSQAFRDARSLSITSPDTGQATYGGGEETASAVASTWLADTRKAGLLAAVGVGTIDQALMGVLPAKHQSLRLLGLARDVLIVDEVHAYDEYMQAILRTLLEFQAMHGASVILLSATLPAKMRHGLCTAFERGLGRQKPGAALTNNDYPLATHVSQTGKKAHALEASTRSFKNVPVCFVHNEDDARERLIKVARQGGCACWIRNTVGDAMAAYESVQGIEGVEPMLFHARFAMGDRQDIENKVIAFFGKKSTPEQRAGRLLIATQVVEQSLDLDFDDMVSDLAPIDLLIQRAGRLHRHERAERAAGSAGELCVLAPEWTEDPQSGWYSDAFPAASYVYIDPAQLWLTMKVLKDEGALTIPTRARHLVESVYDPLEPAPAGLTVALDKADGQRAADRAMGKFQALDAQRGFGTEMSNWVPDTRAVTRLGEPTTTIRLARVENGQLKPWSAGYFGWEMSQVSLRSTVLSDENIPRSLQQAAEAARETMNDRGRWSVLLPLVPQPEGTFIGSALNGKGEPTEFIYCEQLGLRPLTLKTSKTSKKESESR